MVTSMATQSLYRRYRPRRFSEVKGQDHVVRALRNAVAEGREGQAYLFSGPRGTGKTTSARILAKVLNCERPVDGEPCCECDSCLAVEQGTSYDVHELDAASNNGVEAMRDLIEKASLGTPGRHKVYILDEVHMLSKGAEAALLKTLEEPPPHVVFALATTDPQRVSETIRSRTQHLQFHLLPTETLHEHVKWVVDDAGLDVSEQAIGDVLALGGGSARDTLSALELVSNAGGEHVESLALDEFAEALIDRDPGTALTVVAKAIALGRDPRTMTEELIGYLRNGFLSLMAPELVQLPADRVDAIAEHARRLGPQMLVRGIEVLGSSLVEMRQAPDPRVLLDVAIVQLSSDSVAPDVPALLTRLDRIEQRLDEVATAGPAAPASPVDAATGRASLGARARRTPPASAGSAPAEPPAPAATPQQTEPPESSSPAPAASEPAVASPDPGPGVTAATAPITRDDWEETIRPGLRGMARAVFAPAEFVSSTESSLTLALPNAVHRGKCEQQREVVEAALSAHRGTAVALELLDGDDDDGGGGGDGGGGRARRTDAPTSSGSPVDRARGTPDTAGVDADDARGSGRGDDALGASHELPDDGEIDVHDLVDIPPEAVKTPIDRLAEAFPGSELIDESA